MSIKTYKYRIYPNNEQQEMFARIFGCCRLVWNNTLDRKSKMYSRRKESLNIGDAKKLLPVMKEYNTFLKEVDSIALQQSVERLFNAFDNFFAGRSGYPKFKSKYDTQSYTTKMVNNNIKIESNYIRLPKVGRIKMVKHRPFEGTIKTVTVKKVPSGKYFVCISSEVEIPKLPSINKVIGIDVGIKDFCTDHNGNHYSNPKYLDKSLKKLKRAQRCLSRKKKSSFNYNKQRIKVARIHEHITNQRTDHHHKLSTQFISENQTIVIEHLDVKAMLQNTDYARYIADVAWGKFFILLEEKAITHERELIKIDTFYPSSQLCSCCGYKNPLVKNLNVRNWTCPVCNTKHNRDENAAINILSKGLGLRSEA